MNDLSLLVRERRALEMAPPLGDIETFARSLRNIVMASDFAGHHDLNAARLPIGIRQILFIDRDLGKAIGSTCDHGADPISGNAAVDALLMHTDYRNRLWADTALMAVDGDTITLSVGFAPLP